MMQRWRNRRHAHEKNDKEQQVERLDDQFKEETQRRLTRLEAQVNVLRKRALIQEGNGQ